MTDYVNDSYVPIPMPGILSGTDHHDKSVNSLTETDPEAAAVLAQLRDALDDCAKYGQTLWTQLIRTGDYLREQVAREGSGRMLQTDEQWQAWQVAYSTVLSALAGPHGDSGYGRDQATLERQHHAH